MKILVLCSDRTLSGGVANLYRAISPYLGDDFVFYKRKSYKSLLGKILSTLFYQIYFLFYCRKFDVILLNPSLNPNAVLRDGVYAYLAKVIMRKKVVVFWQGWNFDCEKDIEKRYLSRFRRHFFRVDKMLVLSSLFSNTLRRWGYKNSVEFMTTCYEPCEIEKTYSNKAPFKIIFLSRVELEKGIFIAIEALKIAREKCDVPVILQIAGDGKALAQAKEVVAEQQIQGVEFTGYIRGAEKNKELFQSDIFILPSYTEGMPGALLEAMAAGLAVLIRDVGGVPDFFTEKMGYMTNSYEPEVFADFIVELISSPEKIEEIGRYNRQYAQENFVVSKVAEKLKERIATIA